MSISSVSSLTNGAMAMMIGEVGQVDTGLAAGSGPAMRLLIVISPVRADNRGQPWLPRLCDVFHECAGIVELSAGVGKAKQIAEQHRADSLVVLDRLRPIHIAKSTREVIAGYGQNQPTAIELCRRRSDSGRRHDWRGRDRPVDRLVHVPHPGGVDTGVRRSKQARELQGDTNTKKTRPVRIFIYPIMGLRHL